MTDVNFYICCVVKCCYKIVIMRKVFFTLLMAVTATAASAQDWPQFLGPTADSKSPQKNLLREWPAAGPEVKWTTAVGIGYGGPVVRDGKVYLLDRDDALHRPCNGQGFVGLHLSFDGCCDVPRFA